MAHTPGPWAAEYAMEKDEGRFEAYINAPNEAEMRFAVVTGWTQEQTEANARLIAKAPKMYAWIKSLRIYLTELANGNLPKKQFDYAQAAREASALVREIEGG